MTSGILHKVKTNIINIYQLDTLIYNLFALYGRKKYINMLHIFYKFFFIYMFTPLGKLLHIRFWWNKNNITNLNKENNVMFDYSSESFNLYYEHDEEHYIEYHPV
ncbi:hypothetical protein PVMG_06105 [Plasmodium vivax Mauritania I]|uniref:Uncharacterized protein n=1 Tax=Plasmodium vivax Mauritania I TaxID=1035515 RepID=A0A0J9W5H3_PLAVI|nr:hypothetical protein PVMG_06105 [Plasmodium vivax Mauritania I]